MVRTLEIPLPPLAAAIFLLIFSINYYHLVLVVLSCEVKGLFPAYKRLHGLNTVQSHSFIHSLVLVHTVVSDKEDPPPPHHLPSDLPQSAVETSEESRA